MHHLLTSPLFSPVASMLSFFLATTDMGCDPPSLALLLDMPQEEITGLLAAMENLGLIERDHLGRLQLSSSLPRNRELLTTLQRQLAGHGDLFSSHSMAGSLIRLFNDDVLGFCTQGLEVFRRLIALNRVLAARCAYDILSRTLLRTRIALRDRELCAQFIALALQIQHEMQLFPWRVMHAIPFYYKLRALAFYLGDKRTLGIIDLSIGTMNLNHRSLKQSLFLHEVMLRGINTINALGDADILVQASGMTCFYYYVEAKFTKAINCAYSALYAPETAKSHNLERLLYSYAALSAISLGEYDVAVNILTLAINQAREREHILDVGGMEAILAHIYILQHRYDEALELISNLLGTHNIFALTYADMRASRSLAYYHYMLGHIRHSYVSFKNWLHKTSAMGLTHTNYVAAPFVLDLLAAYELAGFEPPHGQPLERELELAVASPSPLMQGTAWRIKAQVRAHSEGWADKEVRDNLQKSLDIFRTLTAPIDMAQTLMALARSFLAMGNPARAATIATEAWGISQRYGQPPWPEDLNDLLEQPTAVAAQPTLTPVALGVSLFQTLRQQYSWESNEDFFKNLLYSLLATFGAHRGGIFLLRDNQCIPLTTAHLEEGSLRAAFPLLLVQHPTQSSHYSGSLLEEGTAERGMGEGPMSLVLAVNTEGEGRYRIYLEGGFRQTVREVLGRELYTLLENYLATEISIHVRRNAAWTSRAMPSLHGNGDSLPTFLFQTRAMTKLMERVDRLARKDTTVLILGESGVGKELIARRLHELSGRQGAFVGVNLASTPEELFESEFYGHEKGSFTGADQQKRGLFELADKGTLFIDEVGDIPPRMQVKLLRVLQEKQFMRVGGTRSLHSDFRLIAATNRNLEEDVRQGLFREDLYYRLSVVPLHVPPLRERPEDIVPLAEHFLRYYAARHQSSVKEFSLGLQEQILAYSWPGNVRELKNYVERYTLVADRDEWLPPSSSRTPAPLPTALVVPEGGVPAPLVSGGAPLPAFTGNMSLEELEARYFEYQYVQCNGVISGPKGVTTILGISRATAYKWIDKLGLKERFAKELVKRG